MTKKSLKDILAEKTLKQEQDKQVLATPVIIETPEVTWTTLTTEPVMSVVPEFKEEPKVQLTEDVKQKLYEEMRNEIRKELTEEIRKELTEEIRKELEATKTQLHEQFIPNLFEKMDRSNTILVEAVGKLYRRIESLQESLNIEIPTPIVNVTVPNRKTTKKIVRDEKGLITHISDEES